MLQVQQHKKQKVAVSEGKAPSFDDDNLQKAILTQLLSLLVGTGGWEDKTTANRFKLELPLGSLEPKKFEESRKFQEVLQKTLDKSTQGVKVDLEFSVGGGIYDLAVIVEIVDVELFKKHHALEKKPQRVAVALPVVQRQYSDAEQKAIVAKLQTLTGKEWNGFCNTQTGKFQAVLTLGGCMTKKMIKQGKELQQALQNTNVVKVERRNNTLIAEDFNLKFFHDLIALKGCDYPQAKKPSLSVKN